MSPTGPTADRNPIFVVGSFMAAYSVKVARLPGAGETLRAESFLLEAGGKGFNCAVAAHRLGVAIDGLLAVGSDLFAEFAAGALADAGLPQTMLVRFAGQTGAGVGFVDRQGENCIAVYPAANELLSSREIMAARERLRRARFVVAQFEIGDEPIVTAFAEARALGITTVLNPSPFRPIPPEILCNADVLVLNRSETVSLCHAAGLADDRSLASRLFGHGIETLITTAGSAGAKAWRKGVEPLFQPAFPVDAVDTIGAGDAFLGGMLAALSVGLVLGDGLRWGAACGGLATTKAGLLEALPTRVELLAFLEAHPAV